MKSSPPPLTPKFTILVVDDNLTLQEILLRQLTRSGYDVKTIGTGRQALEWLQINKADLIVLDVMLPEMTGYECCLKIRERFTAAQLPIIMLSALGQDVEDRIKGLKAGANDFLAKPYHIDELRARIENLLTTHPRG
jgi:DNA-binding response OmpR family regulator